MNILFWLPLLAASLHIVEEFAWPGGFAVWYRSYLPDIAASVSRRFLFWINVALLFACFSVGVDGPSPYGAALFLTVMALLFANGVFHFIATMKGKRYSPGVVTGVALYLPLAIAGYAIILRSHRASFGTAVVAVILGGSYQFISWSIHRRRAARLAG
ncbi:MAG: hypothetical protein DMF56_18980 [Acidobacteria bacterium]|nr:MAG: hypothetical protein DMF56_18980 [Acidobacteriota bacterium]